MLLFYVFGNCRLGKLTGSARGAPASGPAVFTIPGCFPRAGWLLLTTPDLHSMAPVWGRQSGLQHELYQAAINTQRQK